MCSRAIVALLLVAGLLATGCGLPGQRTVKVSEADAGRSIELRAGDRLEVALAGNPTTGYSWAVTAKDPAVLSQVGEPAFKPDSTLIGSGGTVTTGFQAQGEGRTVLRLAYQRSWEKDVPAIKTFEVTIVVK